MTLAITRDVADYLKTQFKPSEVDAAFDDHEFELIEAKKE